MLFWIAAAALAAAVTYAVTRPLAGAAPEASADSDAAADLAVYKDQLNEIDADVARGAMPTAEAEAARAEVARRMLRRAEPDRAVKREVGASRVALNRAYAAAAIALPVLSLGLYLKFGAPGLPGQPLSARLEAPVDPAKGNDLVAKVEAALRANPEDGRGWDVIAPVYAAQARFADAASAYANALRLNGETLARLLGFADARIRVENGLIPEDARKALQRANALDPKRVEPRLWLGLAKEQDGDAKAAITDYRAMLAEAPADAHWRKMLEDRIAALERGAPQAPQASQAPKPSPGQSQAGPSQADVAAFDAMTPDERAAKINQMVDGLAARLKAQPKDPEGWRRLIRSYAMLGRRDDATKAAVDARLNLSGDAPEIAALDALVKEIGLAQ